VSEHYKTFNLYVMSHVKIILKSITAYKTELFVIFFSSITLRYEMTDEQTDRQTKDRQTEC